MDSSPGINKTFHKVLHQAWMKNDCYEKLYSGVNGRGKQYLQTQSKKYKNIVLEIQELIEPAVNRNCPDCQLCCKLHSPEIKVYTTGSVGCFTFVDYILARCDSEFPDPIFERMESNQCPYFSTQGCTLTTDCRSYACISFFCDDIKNEINMDAVSEHLDKLKSIVDQFSVPECMEF